MNRALIIESARDDVARKRRSAIQHSEKLSQWEITFVFTIEDEDLPWQSLVLEGSILTGAAAFGEPIPLDSVEERLFYRTKGQVIAFKPEIVLVYTGFIFKRYKEDVYQALRRLRKDHPELRMGRFGADTSSACNAPDDVFDRDADVIAVEKLFSEEILTRRRQRVE